MPKNCSKETYVQKLLAQFSKTHNTKHINQHIIEYAVDNYADTKDSYCDDTKKGFFRYSRKIRHGDFT